MATEDSLIPSLLRKLLITTALALLALAYARPALSTGRAAAEAPAACGKPATAIAAGLAAEFAARAGDCSPRRACPDVRDRVSMKIAFDPATHLVSVTLQPKDAEDEFVSNLERNDFVVYDDGVRQRDALVSVERPPATIGLLIEHGGRYQMLNEAISQAASSVANQFLDEVRPGDRVAVWVYGNRLEQVTGFAEGRDAVLDAFDRLNDPLPLSESNLYDALTGALARMQEVGGPKALILISSGLDTFSRTSLADVLRTARCSGTAVYAIDLAPMLRQEVLLGTDAGPYGRLDWSRAKSALARIARASGGRLYVPESVLDLPGDYDDLMENVRARYLVTYRPESSTSSEGPRTVRVELREETGTLSAANRKRRREQVLMTVQGSYLPANMLAGNGVPGRTEKGAKQ